jgi:hypothetical protein
MKAKITDPEYLAAIERAEKVYQRATDPVFTWCRVFKILAHQEHDDAYGADAASPASLGAATVAFAESIRQLDAQVAELTARPLEVLNAAKKSAADTYEMLWGVRP